MPARLGYGAGTPPTPRDVRRPPVARVSIPAWTERNARARRVAGGCSADWSNSRVPRQQGTPRDAVIYKPRKGQCGEAGVWPCETEAQTDRKLAVIGLGRLSPVCAISSGSSQGRGPRLGSRGNGGPALRYRYSVSFVTPPTGCSQRIAARRRAAWDLRAGDGGLLLGSNGIRFNVSASAPRA